MIKVKKAIISMSVNELEQILAEVKKGIEKTSFTNAPMPDCDMSKQDRIREKRLRGIFTIEGRNITFEITEPIFRRKSESEWYKLNLLKGGVTKNGYTGSRRTL